MKIEYIYEYDDYLAIYEARRKIDKYSLWFNRFIFFFITVNLIVGIYYLYGIVIEGQPAVWFKFLNLAMAIILIIRVYIFEKWWRKKQAIQQNMLGRAISIELVPERITAHTEHHDNQISWKGIEMIVETSKNFVVFLNKLNALSIPKRAFKNDDQIEEFRQLISSNYAGEVR